MSHPHRLNGCAGRPLATCSRVRYRLARSRRRMSRSAHVRTARQGMEQRTTRQERENGSHANIAGGAPIARGCARLARRRNTTRSKHQGRGGSPGDCHAKCRSSLAGPCARARRVCDACETPRRRADRAAAAESPATGRHLDLRRSSRRSGAREYPRARREIRDRARAVDGIAFAPGRSAPGVREGRRADVRLGPLDALARRAGRVAKRAAPADPGSTNTGPAPIEIICVNLKPVPHTPPRRPTGSPSTATSTIRTFRARICSRMIVIVQRFTVNPGQWEGVHAHHPDMLYIHIKGGQWAARSKTEPEHPYPQPSPDGEVGWMPTIPLSVGHESGNIGKAPIDLIWVTLRSSDCAFRAAPYYRRRRDAGGKDVDEAGRPQPLAGIDGELRRARRRYRLGSLQRRVDRGAQGGRIPGDGRGSCRRGGDPRRTCSGGPRYSGGGGGGDRGGPSSRRCGAIFPRGPARRHQGVHTAGNRLHGQYRSD